MNNQESKVRPQVVNVNSNELCFLLLVLKQVNVAVVVTQPIIHMKKCVPDVVKSLNVKVSNLMS